MRLSRSGSALCLPVILALAGAAAAEPAPAKTEPPGQAAGGSAAASVSEAPKPAPDSGPGLRFQVPDEAVPATGAAPARVDDRQPPRADDGPPAPIDLRIAPAARYAPPPGTDPRDEASARYLPPTLAEPERPGTVALWEADLPARQRDAAPGPDVHPAARTDGGTLCTAPPDPLWLVALKTGWAQDRYGNAEPLPDQPSYWPFPCY